MGTMIDGRWETEANHALTENGRYIRKDSQFRNWVTADGASGFPAEAGRYHLYVSYQCPWAHRALLYRALKGLQGAIGVSIAVPNDRRMSWEFRDDGTGTTEDAAEGFAYLYEAYAAADPIYSGIASVPVLWDRARRTIVNNESSEIIRMLNSAFDAFATNKQDFYPPDLRADIDAMNEKIYAGLNNGVYRCGFAAVQAAYEEGCRQVFATLDALEAHLAGARYLVGGRITEADWRLFITLVRFDAVYHSLFRCSLRTLESYPALSAYMRDLYQQPGVAETVRIDHIVRGYFSIPRANPSRIVPLPPQDFASRLSQPHGRETMQS
ncbi:glutathione S-transferase family protein [Aquabacter spiritensis]|uniref:Putative glutathione S-transferase n=1 Tax=Aquabacter spiritensis TaxID=933073 RepID=A0A4R3LQV0_9HYPH|nr:glutathione S-transferase C-terminal domain-containing protein [Aquabacter spiritensis]TCT02944.1 putative glutathione S-transferase [Aquabacter spiritensis]